MIDTARLVLQLFEPRDRRLLVLLVVLFVFTAVVQTLSVASILPFMSLVGDPSVIQENDLLSRLHATMGSPSERSFLLLVGFGVLVLMAVSNALNATTQWAVIRFGWHHQDRICVRLLSRYVSEPYEFFLSRNTAELTKTMFAEVSEAINGVINPGIRMIAQAIVVLSIFSLLLAVDPIIAIVSTVVLAGAYGAIYTLVRHEQARLGRVRMKAHADRFRSADEALSGIKESKVLGREQAFIERFSGPSREFSRVSSRNAVIVAIPGYVLETLAFGGILLIVLFMMRTRQDDYSEVVAIMSLYAVAGYRLMPALKLVFTGLAKVRFYGSAVENVHEHLQLAAESPPREVALPKGDAVPRLYLERAIRLDRVHFRYPNTKTDVLRDVTLEIPIRSSVGLVGGTGSGKTTLVDLVLGLLEPTSGRILIDSTILTKELHRSWRRSLGYVPQDIFLCDDTIARNIGFGLPTEDIDREAMERAARAAQIHDFICSLPRRYDTVVGERGIRLSGGQRQRIGVARALYGDPEVLILDEATSALDGITEDAVMDAIRVLGGKKTMILVAHRVTTLRDCDMIYHFRDGQLWESGTYDELMAGSARFRAMAKSSQVEAASAK